MSEPNRELNILSHNLGSASEEKDSDVIVAGAAFILYATHTITHAKKKKHDLGPRLVYSFSNSPMVLDGADCIYGWLHPEVNNRRRDTPKDNERNDHLEKSDDESELRLGV